MNSKSESNTNSSIPMQIRIGVTGHRNLENTSQLKRSIRDALTKSLNAILQINNKMTETLPTYRVITPLADGADRLIAIEAMSVLNAKMEVVLPMIKEEYKATFYSDESRKEFENLLTKAAGIHSLISKPLQEHFPGLDIDKCRRAAYKVIGEHIVDNCDILIVVWDGKKMDGESGTYVTLTYARIKKKPIIIIGSQPPNDISIELA